MTEQEKNMLREGIPAFTPGAWDIDEMSGHIYSEHSVIGSVYGGRGYDGLVNGRLMSASLDLFQALFDLLTAIDDSAADEHDPDVDILAAYVKAINAMTKAGFVHPPNWLAHLAQARKEYDQVEEKRNDQP